MSDYASLQVGAFVAPLDPSTAHSLLQDADPALFAVLGFVQAVLQAHLGARFDAEVVKAGLPALAGKISALAIPYDPLPFLQQAQLEPPFVALYVPRERSEGKTRQYYHLVETWKLLWVLPPLTPAQFLQLSSFRRAVFKVVNDRIDQGYDPAYQDGAQVVEAGGIEQINVVEASYGTIQGLRTELFFPAVELEIEVMERRMATPGLDSLAGVDGSVKVNNPDGTNPLTLIEFQKDLP